MQIDISTNTYSVSNLSSLLLDHVKTWRTFEDFNMFERDSIFFVESNPDVTHINPVSQCALESAATQNPDRFVFYVIDFASKLQAGNSVIN